MSRLAALLKAGPAIVTFYRGGCCPYCNIQLRAYQAVLPEMTALGARLVAISPQLPDSSLSTAESNELTFAVLSDVGNRVARTFGLVWSLPEELRAALRSSDKALPRINGDDSWELPVPATCVIARDRRVALAGIDVDYRNRLEFRRHYRHTTVAAPGVTLPGTRENAPSAASRLYRKWRQQHCPKEAP